MHNLQAASNSQQSYFNCHCTKCGHMHCIAITSLYEIMVNNNIEMVLVVTVQKRNNVKWCGLSFYFDKHQELFLWALSIVDAIDVYAKMIHMFIIYFDKLDASIHFF